MCQKLNVVEAATTNEGETSTRSEMLDWLAENHECVGVCDCAVEYAQLTEPLSMLFVQPALSKPPPD